MTPLPAANLRPPLLLRRATAFKQFCSASLTLPSTIPASPPSSETPAPPRPVRKPKGGSSRRVLSEAQLRKNWLESLSCPSLQKTTDDSECCLSSNQDAGSQWVIGVDPDVSGAVAVLKPDLSGRVFDSPHLKVLIGKQIRKRLDARSIFQLLQSFNAPRGTTAFIEQSLPYPKDGKQGWWSGGFNYGLWIGILVASGYSVVPVTSLAWKNEYKLSGSNSSKDNSREVACLMFPSMSALLKRKKDHGRAEALLISAYGKGLKLNSEISCIADN